MLQKINQSEPWQNKENQQTKLKDNKKQKRIHLHNQTFYNCNSGNSSLLLEGGQSQDANSKPKNGMVQQSNQDYTRNSLQFVPKQQIIDSSQQYQEKPKSKNDQSGFSGRNKNQLMISGERSSSTQNNQNLGTQILDSGNIQSNKQQNLNLIKNSKNRKLYTSIGAYNNNMTGGMNQANKSIHDSNISSMSGLNNMSTFNQAQKNNGITINNTSEILQFSGQNTSNNNKIKSSLINNDQIFSVVNGTTGTNSLYNALAQTNMGKFGNLQQRNLIISQQQSLKNKVKLQAFDIDSQGASEQHKQIQKGVKSQLDSSQNVHQAFVQQQQLVNQQNQILKKQDIIQQGVTNKQKNKSFNDKQNEINQKTNSNQPKFQSDIIRGINQQNQNVFSMDPQQRKFDLIQNINQNQTHAYKSMLQDDPLENTTDLSVLSAGNKTFMINQSNALNNQALISQNERNSFLQENKNRNGINSNKKLKNIKDIQQITHNSVIIQRNSSNSKQNNVLVNSNTQKNERGSSFQNKVVQKNAKRNTITTQNIDQQQLLLDYNNFQNIQQTQSNQFSTNQNTDQTRFGNYIIDQQSKEYLENSFQSNPNAVNLIHLNNQYSGEGVPSMPLQKNTFSNNRVTSKMMTIGSSQKQNQQEEYLQQNTQQEEFQLSQDEQSKQYQNIKQRPHSSFKAQTQKQIHIYKQQQVQKQNGGVVMIPKQDVQLNMQEKIGDIFQDNGRDNSKLNNQNTNITSGQNSGLINFTSNQQIVENQNKNLSGRRSLIYNQQLLIGPDGVIGIAPSQFNSNFTNGNKTVGGQRKNKKINQQISINKAGDLVLSNTINNQKSNQISVYQNQIVSDVNYRQPRRVGRGGSGAVNSGIAARNDFNNTTHENREMRTSSAGPGISNTEFRYLNFTGNLSGKQNSGNVIFNNFNLQNQNQNYINGGGEIPVASAQITEGIIKAGNTVTIPSYKKDSIFIPQIKNNTQLLNSNKHNQKNSAVSLVMSQKQINDVQNARNIQGNNKSSKRNVVNGTLSSGDYLKKGNDLQNMKIDQLLSSTNKSMMNQKKHNQDQLAIFQNIDTIRSGDGYIGRFNNQLINHESPIYNEELQSQSLNETKNKIKNQINHNSLILYEQQQKLQTSSNPRNYKEEGHKVKSNSKESRVSMRNSVISGNGVQSNGNATPHERDLSSNIMQQANKTHQQSMQKFLQQQMSMYYQAPLSNNANQIFNPIQNSGTRINTTLSQQHQQLKKKVHLQNGQVIRQQNSSQITNVSFLNNNQQSQGYQGQGNIVIQGSQGQVIQGQGSGQNKIRQSAQKLQKKQMKDFINLSASERLKGMQTQKDISRKSGTQTAIGIGGSSINQAQKVTTVLNSNQIQFQKQINQAKIQSQSLSRSRINSQNKQKMQQIANGIIIERQSMQNDVDRNLTKNGDLIKMNKQIIGQKEYLPGSVTPELLNHQRIQLMSGSNFANQRNFYTQINNTKNQMDDYQADLKSSTSAHEDDKIQIIQNNLQDHHFQQKKQIQLNKKSHVNDQIKQEINSPTAQRNNQTELSLLRLQNYQLEMAKQAIREMRLALNKNKQDSSKNDNQYSKQRPKSQNDMNANIKIQVENGGREDSQNDIDYNDQIFEFEGDSSANIPKNPNQRNENSIKSKIENNQFLAIESNPSQEGSVSKKYQDQTHTQNKEIFFENEIANEKEDEIDKEQFLEIVSKTFDKIIQQLHSGIRDPLAQMKIMYQHYIQQIEQNNSYEQSTLAIQMQEMQNTITHINSENLQLKIQINQTQQNKSKNQIQIQKDELEKQIKNLKNQLDDAQFYKQKYENMKVEMQNQNEIKRENVGKSAIEDMKKNLQQQKNEKNKNVQINKISQLDQAFRLNEDEFLDDSSLDNLIQGIPQQNLENILFKQNNSSNLILQDGPNNDKNKFKQNDMSIKIIENFQKEQKKEIGFENEFERDESQMSSIPRYENDKQLKLKQFNERNSQIQQQLTIENDREMEFDENNEDSPSDSKRRRIMENDIENDDQVHLNQSYFSSRINSSSDTINSEVIAAYQEALQNSSNLVFEDSRSPNKIQNSKSKNKKVKGPLKIPALDFEKIQEQYELDIQQEEFMNQQQNQEEQQSNPDTGKMSHFEDDDSSQELQEMQDLIGKIMNQEQQNNQKNINKSQFNQQINLQAFQNQEKGKNNKIQGGLGLAIDLNQVKKEKGNQSILQGKNINDYQLNLNKIEAKNQDNENDFQDEFMAKYDEFSESWRMMIQKQKRF